MGCAGRQVTSRHSPFLGDFSQFKQVNESTWIFLHQNMRVADYDKFLFNSVSIYPTDSNNKSKIFYQKAVAAFEDKYTLVKQKDGGVIRIYMAVIKNDSKKETRFEVDCLDSISEERITAMVSLVQGEGDLEAPFEAWLGQLRKLLDSGKGTAPADRQFPILRIKRTLEENN